MVQWQICTLEHLMNSGFGCPFPRHGLQLLFWFANQCVTCEPINFVVIMKLVSDCQPENGFFGFHQFGNVEELLPVLKKPKKRKGKTKVVYYEVGNLNTETYPASANLPAYVRENYGLYGDYNTDNIDRIIIGYQVKTRVVETVYVTEHDGAAFGRFSTDRTYEVSPELIQVLQNPQLDLTTFLTQTGYWGDMQVDQADNTGEIRYPDPSVQEIFNLMQNYSGSVARAVHDDLSFFSETFNLPLDVNMEPFSYDQYGNHMVSGVVAGYSEVQRKHRKPKAKKKPRVYDDSYWLSALGPPKGQRAFSYYSRFDEEDRRWNRGGGGGGGGGGGISFMKILLGAGALYLAAKCFSWLRSLWEEDLNEYIIKKIPWRTPTYQHHVMLDYVY